MRLPLILSFLLLTFVFSGSPCHAQKLLASLGETRRVYDLAFSPDGDTLAVASVGNRSIHLWDTNTLKQRATLKGHTEIVYSLAFSPDGKLLASGAADGFVKIWDVKTGKHLRDLSEWKEKSFRWVSSMAFSPDGTILATAIIGDKGDLIRLWDTATWKLKRETKTAGPVRCVVFSRNGKKLFLGRQEIEQLDVATGNSEFSFAADRKMEIYSLVVNNSANLVVSSRRGNVAVWDLTEKKFQRLILVTTQDVPGIARNQAGNMLAVTDGDRLRFYNLETGKHIGNVKSKAMSHVLTFSPDSRFLAVDSNGGVLLFRTPTPVYNFKDNLGFIRTLTFRPKKNTLAVAGTSGLIQFWNLKTNKHSKITNGHKRSVNSVVFSPDGQTFASAGNDNTVKLWNAENRQLQHSLKRHTGFVTAVAFSPDGQTLASASQDKTVILWDKSGKIRHILKGHRARVRTVDFHPKGTLLASAGSDGTIRLWETATGKEKRILKGYRGSVLSVIFSHDGKTILSAGSDTTIRLWDVATGKEKAILKGHSASVNRLAIHPQGKLLASAGSDKLVILWDPETGKRLKTFRQHALPVSAVAFSPDGKWLASGSWDGTVKFWDLVGVPNMPVRVRKSVP